MVNQTEQKKTKTNPFTTALVIGLGWGLAFGFWDGLPILLELPILPHLRVRLQALTYLMVWCGLTGAILLGLFGAVAWGLLRFLRREVRSRTLVAIYSGIFISLAVLATGIYRFNPTGSYTNPDHIGIALLLTGLGGVIGLAIALGTYSGAAWWQNRQGFLRPLRWKLVPIGVVIVFLGGVIALSAVGVYRNYLRDLAIFQPQPSGQVATPEQPNVLLITIDALRADHLGIYGYDPEISPNIDALGKGGVVFDQAISQSPWTAPSVASFVTSLHPLEVGVCRQGIVGDDQRVDRMRTTLAEALQEANYRTQAYTTNLIVAPVNQYEQGFDGFEGARPTFSFDLNALHRRTLVGLLCQMPSVCGVLDRGYSQLFDPVIGWNSDPWVTERGKRFLNLHKDERFFLWLYYVGPHAYYDPPQPFRPLPSEITPGRETYLRTTAHDLRMGEELFREVDRQAMISLYNGEIAYTDALVGEVLDELNKLELADRTVIILNADHGEEFADHGGYGHGHTLYDELVRVPFIISGPGVKVTGQRVGMQVSLLDLVPTVCEITGAPVQRKPGGVAWCPF